MTQRKPIKDPTKQKKPSKKKKVKKRKIRNYDRENELRKNRRLKKSRREEYDLRNRKRNKERKDAEPKARREEYELRTRKKNKRKDEQLLTEYETYSPWLEDYIPADPIILQYFKNPNVALATFRLMLGIPGDIRVPQDLSFKFNKDKILRAFQAAAGHQAPIRLCGVCGIFNVMTNEDFHLLHMGHRKVLFQKVDNDKLQKMTHAQRR